jgi:hypothetical protein
MPEPVQVFVSHSHDDDIFTARLVADLRAAGASVWVDDVGESAGIDHGDFLERINQALASSEWLVLVLTPAAVQSPWVRMEVNAALGMAHGAGSQMHEPIPVIAKPCNPRDVPPLWGTLHDYDAVQDYSEALTGLLHTFGLPSSTTTTAPHVEELARRPTVALSMPHRATRIVDASGSGDHSSIVEAIRASSKGERILVHPGVYRGILNIEWPLEIVGVGRASEVIIEGTRESVIGFAADWGRISNITVRQTAHGTQSTAVGIDAGLLEVEGCDITSGNYGLFLSMRAAARIHNCRIHDCGGVAVYLYRWAEVTLQGNDIVGNHDNALMVWGASRAIVRQNRIVGNTGVGIAVSGRSNMLSGRQ